MNGSLIRRMALGMMLVLLLGSFSMAKADKFTQHWMQYLPDDMQISQINMPGTHDSGTRYVEYSDVAKCQSRSIPEQMDDGIRVFDIRCHYNSKHTGIKDYLYLQITHENAKCYIDSGNKYRISLQDVMNWACNFLDQHESETIILQVSREGDDNEKSEKQLIEGLIPDYIYNRTKEPQRFKRCVAYPTSKQSPVVIPTLGDVRGKCVIYYSNGDAQTRYETEYCYYPRGTGNNDISPTKKVERQTKVRNIAVDNRWIQKYFSSEIGIAGRDVLYNTGNERMEDIVPHDPRSIKCLSTNLTGFGGKRWQNPLAYLDGRFPETLAGKVFAKFDKDKFSWTPGYRYGWLSMDFPQDWFTKDFINSNYALPTVLLCYDLSGDNLSLQELDMIDVQVHGVVKQPETLHRVKRRTSLYAVGYLPQYMFKPVGPASTETIYAELVGSEDGQINVNGRIYDIVRNRKCVAKDPLSADDEYPGVWYIINEQIRLVENKDWQEYPGMIRWISDPRDIEDRPADLKAFFETIGSLVWQATDSDGVTYVQIFDGSEASIHPSIEMTKEKYTPEWRLKAILPQTNEKGEYLDWVLTGVDGISELSAYSVMRSGYRQLDMWWRDNPTVDRTIAYLNWVDGNDKYGLRQSAESSILNDGVRFRAIYEALNGTYAGKYANGYRSEDGLRIENDQEVKATVPSRLFFKETNRLGYLSTYSAELPVNSTTGNIGVYHPEHKERSDKHGTEYTLTLWSRIETEVHWADHDDEIGVRPYYVRMAVEDIDAQTAWTIALVGEKDEKTWADDSVDRLFEVKEDGKQVEINMAHYNITLQDGLDLQYSVAEAKVTKTIGQDGLPEFKIDVTLTLKGEEFVRVEGNVIWVNGDLGPDRRRMEPALELQESGVQYMPGVVFPEINDEKSFYSFEPAEEIKVKREDGTLAQYTVDALPIKGYPISYVVGTDVYYVRGVNMTGTVKWNGKRPTAQAPVAWLVGPNGSEIRSQECVYDDFTGAFVYAFNDLPISDSDDIPYQYTLKVTLNGCDVVVDYRTPVRDRQTGNITADANLYAPEQPVTAQIPLKLNLKGIDPSSVTDLFKFVLECENDDSIKPQKMVLSRANSFQDVFTLEGITDTSKEYVFTVRQTDVMASDFWTYDVTQKPVTIKLRFLNGTPVAQVDMGGAKSLQFINEYSIPNLDITVSTVWVDNNKIKWPLPDQLVVLLCANGEPVDQATLTAANGWSCTFANKPLFGADGFKSRSPMMEPIEYTIVAEEAYGFNQEVTGDKYDGFVITYTAFIIPPKTGDETNMALLLSIAMLSTAALVLLRRRRRA